VKSHKLTFPSLCDTSCSWRHTKTAYILCLPYQTHLIQLISSLTHLIMSWWVESGVFDKGDKEYAQCWCAAKLVSW